MLFNSLVFLLFFAVFMAGWAAARRHGTARWGYLTAMSCVFYGWWDWRFLFLILFSGLIDYGAGLLMERDPGRRRLWFVLSLIGNLGSLSVFKYSGFIARSMDGMAEALWGVPIGLEAHIPEFALILPVGISFYTFQSMSYTIDIYRGRLRPVHSILHFFAYLMMFPQLVAGPIVRAKDMLGQLAATRPITANGAWLGLKLFVFGMFQKVVLADNVAYMADSVFGGTSPYAGAAVHWVASAAFAMQIYCDFSGYSLMACGLARMMGYRFKMNFNHPYRSASFREFWGRWHISLSTWFRDYVYIALGGNRRGLWHGIAFMGITMAVSGLWHGAAWTFIAWGLLHAGLLGAERLLSPSLGGSIPTAWRRPMAMAVVLIGVLVAWVFFRAQSLGQAADILSQMFTGRWDWEFYKFFGSQMAYLGLAVAVEVCLAVLNSRGEVSLRLARRPMLDAAAVALVAAMCVFLRGPQAEFIYFQF